MTIITDELVEAVARKMCRLEDYHIEGEWDGQPAWKSYIKPARTALETALPLIGEKLVKEADNHILYATGDGFLTPHMIRALCGVKEG